MLSSRTTARGFTLIEAMIAIALLALLLLVAMPAFMTMISNLRVRSVSESILSGIQVARTEALKRNQVVTFRLDSATGGGWSVVLADNTVTQAKSASEGGAVEVAVETGATEIVFNNLGRRQLPEAPPAILKVDVSNPDIGSCEPAGSVRCLRITVGIGGEVRLCDPKRPTGDPQAC